MATRLPVKLTTMPDIPKEFGDDGGHFYRYYDELAEEIDEDFVKSLKTQLDGILIFAGLFAGVNSAFLALTLPQLSADAADDTNALLLQIVLGANKSIASAADLPSASFTPPPGIYPINVLFSVSLTFALISSFLAVLGQQWIVHYRKRGGGGPEHQRWEQLRRYLGAKRWRLELVLDDLVPSLLQLGLVVFCIAFALYLGTLSPSLRYIIVLLLCIAAAIVLALSTCAAFDPWCPFKMPLSRVVRPIAAGSIAVVIWLGVCSIGIITNIVTRIMDASMRAILNCHSPDGAERRLRDTSILGFRGLVSICITKLAAIYRRFMSAGVRPADDPDDLKIKALKRVMCTSEDRHALIYSAVNLQVIYDQQALYSLAEDEEFRARLSSLYQTAFKGSQRGWNDSGSLRLDSRVFSTSFFHLLIGAGAIPRLNRSITEVFLSLDIASANLSIRISEKQIRDVHEGSVAFPFTRHCDRCSHCAGLLLCLRAVSLAITSLRHARPPFNVVLEGVVEALAIVDDLRLGCLVATVILCSKRFCDRESWGSGSWPESRLLEELFDAYRSTSELAMFRTITEALTTVRAHWTGKPDHEIYVRLFELCLLPGRKGVSTVDQCTALLCVDDHLLSIERRVRDQNASKKHRQSGRDNQERYIHAATNFVEAHKDSPLEVWGWIGPPLERYLQSVRRLIEADPQHSENYETMATLRRIEFFFLVPWHYKNKSERDEMMVHLKLRQLLSQVESIWERKTYQDMGLRYQPLFCIQDRGTRMNLQETTRLAL